MSGEARCSVVTPRCNITQDYFTKNPLHPNPPWNRPLLWQMKLLIIPEFAHIQRQPLVTQVEAAVWFSVNWIKRMRLPWRHAICDFKRCQFWKATSWNMIESYWMIWNFCRSLSVIFCYPDDRVEPECLHCGCLSGLTVQGCTRSTVYYFGNTHLDGISSHQ